MSTSRKKRLTAWERAEFEYAELMASITMPFLSEPLSPLERVQEMDEIIQTCSWFYPAYLDQACYLLTEGRAEEGEKKLDQGFKLFLEHSRNIQEEADTFLDNLANLWRFDLLLGYVQSLISNYPDTALFHDFLAHAQAMLGHEDQALRSSARAVELEPDNVYFRSNQGWLHLIAGNLDQAESALAKAQKLNPEDRIVQGNLGIAATLKDHGGTYFDYLLRRVDRERLEDLGEERGDWSEVDELCEDINAGRIEAMAMAAVRSQSPPIGLLANRISTLNRFFNFVQGIAQELFLFEDMLFMHFNFRTIMHKFIFKFKDIDHEMIEDIYASVFQFYSFLLGQGFFEHADFKDFQKDTLGMKEELLDKMHRYNAIRHDPNLNEDEKDALRDKIFEGDHYFPFL